MKDIKFEITNIEKERSPFGNAIIEATSIEDNVSVKISISNVLLATRENIKDELTNQYHQQITRRPVEKPIEVGDIL